VATEGRAQPEAIPVALHDRAVDLFTGLARHAEGPGAEARVHVLRGPAGHRELEVVNEARAVERQPRDEAAVHEVDEDRREADLQDMGAQAPEDRPLPPAGPVHLAREVAQDGSREDARKAVEKGGQAAARRDRPREVASAHLAPAAREGIGADPGQVQGTWPGFQLTDAGCGR
jgi:hypothetical protein